jgi:pimeloyl-ACP methyl ester carboxylesterase
MASCVSAPKVQTEVHLGATHLSDRTERRLVADLLRAEAAWEAMENPKAGRQSRALAEDAYNAAVSDWLDDWNDHMRPKRWKDGVVLEHQGHAYRIAIQPAPGNPKEVSPHMIDELRLASDVRIKSDVPVASEDGVGVPFVGRVLRSETLAAQYPMVPLNGGHLTLTAVLEFGPRPGDPNQPRDVALHFYNRLQKEEAAVGGRNQPLAANYTAPKELALNDGFLESFSLVGLLFPEDTIKDSRLYRMEIQDPNRIPVVFVHGLMSDPHIWLNAINAIYSDEVLRENYQPWYFLYPTGLPIPSTSAKLRESLDEAVEALDPEGDDPGMEHMVLIGHSMGGVLSRMQVVDSGDSFWNCMFSKPPEALNVSGTTLDRIRPGFFFEHRPFVKRAVFIATPHRGSPVAEKNIVKWATNLIRLPIDTLLVTKEALSGNLDALSPKIRDWGLYAFNSIGNLSDKHPFFDGLQEPEILVPHHSIIGNAKGDTLLESSDRVVPYVSSHVPSADSELVVPYWHGMVEKPEVTAEVTRILHEHLDSIGR